MTNTATETLADFLLARIAEDEAAVCAGPLWFGRALDPELVHIHWGGPYGNLFHVPANRFSDECEAKRRIVEEHAYDGTQSCQTCTDTQPWWAWPCATLKLLALPYADHPDFRDEWRI